MKRQINYSELMQKANTDASRRLFSHRASCFVTHVRFENGKRIEEREQVREFSKTYGQCLSAALKHLYSNYQVVVSLSTDEVLTRIREEQSWDEMAEQLERVTAFTSSLRFCSKD